MRIRGADLGSESWAMTEQIKAVSRDRVIGRIGSVDRATLTEIGSWLRALVALD